jgi:hypothetical protein
MGWDPMQKIDLRDKPLKWFPGVNSLMTSANNTEGSSFAQNTCHKIQLWNNNNKKKDYCSELYL